MIICFLSAEHTRNLKNMNYTLWFIGKYFLYMGGGNQSFLLLIFLFSLARLIFRAGSDGLYFTRWEVSQKCSAGLISPVQKKLSKAIWRDTINSPVLCVYKLRSHLAAPVNDDFPVTQLTLPQVQDRSCYSQFVLHHGNTLGFGILRAGRPGFESQPCHSLDVWHWLGTYFPDGMMAMICNNAFLKDHWKIKWFKSTCWKSNMESLFHSLHPKLSKSPQYPSGVPNKKLMSTCVHSPFPYYPRVYPYPSPAAISTQYVWNLSIALCIHCHHSSQGWAILPLGLLEELPTWHTCIIKPPFNVSLWVQAEWSFSQTLTSCPSLRSLLWLLIAYGL